MKVSQKIKNKICALIAGNESTTPMSLRAICLNEKMPCMDTVFTWLKEDSIFSDNYAIARERQADWFFDEIDKIGRVPKGERTQAEIAHARLQVDTLKWKLGRMSPKKYNDRVQHVFTDADNAAVKMPSITVNFVRGKAGGNISDN